MAVIVGLCTLELHIPQAGSLKEKRSVLKGMLEGIRTRFNVSAAEVDHLNLWQRSTIAVACVSNSQTFIDQVLNKVVEWVEQNPRALLCTVQVEFL